MKTIRRKVCKMPPSSQHKVCQQACCWLPLGILYFCIYTFCIGVFCIYVLYREWAIFSWIVASSCRSGRIFDIWISGQILTGRREGGCFPEILNSLLPLSQNLKFSILYSIFTNTLNTSHHVLYPHIKRFGRLVLTNGLQYSCNACLIEEANFRINAKKIFQIFIEK